MQPTPLPEPVRAWLAALVDGEGSIMLNKRTYSEARRAKLRTADPRNRAVYTNVRYRPVVVIASNTQYCLMEAIRERLPDVGNIYEHRVSETRPSFNPRARRQWTFRLEVGGTRVVLPQLMDWLVIKQESAQLLLRAIELKESLRPVKGKTPVWADPALRIPVLAELDEIYNKIRASNTRGRVPIERKEVTECNLT